MSKTIIFYILLILNIHCHFATAANIGIRITEGSGSNYIYIDGKIEKGDFFKFKKNLDLLSKHNKMIILGISSTGGDLVEAMKIGKLIRASFILTRAPYKVDDIILCPWTWERNPQRNCASACFIIWASGIERSGNILGLHRPYFSKEYFESLSASQAKIKYTTMSNDVRIYLKEMDIPDNIIEKMFAINSDDILYLEKETIESLEKVPFFDEWIRAECKEPSTEEKEQQMQFFKQTRRLEDFQSEKQKVFNRCRNRKILESQKSSIQN
jgi:hypothetical protein